MDVLANVTPEEIKEIFPNKIGYRVRIREALRAWRERNQTMALSNIQFTGSLTYTTANSQPNQLQPVQSRAPQLETLAGASKGAGNETTVEPTRKRNDAAATAAPVPHQPTKLQTDQSCPPQLDGLARDSDGAANETPVETPGSCIRNDAAAKSAPSVPLQPKKSIVLLLLGQTGVGKSTWINGLVNYLKFQELDDAEKGEPHWPIPMKFSVEDNQAKRQEVQAGDIADENETFQTGESSTKLPKTYDFQVDEDVSIKFIDTPGVDDTRGVDQDKENFVSILHHLNNYKQINGICILLKPNETRLDVMMQYCIKEVIAHLHKNAANNIVFCFTNARGTCFRPGDTYPLLEKLLGKMQCGIKIPLSKRNCFCIDNEAVRFLAEQKCGVNLDPERKADSVNSWRKSVQETERLFRHLLTLTPHNTAEMVTLNRARQMILHLTIPIATIAANIERNLKALQDSEEKMKSFDTKVRSLDKLLTIPAFTLVNKRLDVPMTVCTAQACVEKEAASRHFRRDYCGPIYKVCEKSCPLTNVETNTCPTPAIKACSIFSQETQHSGESALEKTFLERATSGFYSVVNKGSAPFCSECGCSWKTHMHVRVIMEELEIKVPVKNEEVERNLNEAMSDRDRARSHLGTLHERMDSYRRAHKLIYVSASKLAAFLRSHTILVYNNGVAEYLKYRIHRLESEKVAQCCNGEQLKDLTERLEAAKTALEDFEKQAAALDDAIETACQSPPTLQEVWDIITVLRSHEEFGKNLDEICDAEEKAAASNAAKSEIHIRLPKHTRLWKAIDDTLSATMLRLEGSDTEQ